MNNTNPTRPVTGYPAHPNPNPNPNPNGYSSYPYAAAPPPNSGYYTQNPYYTRADPQRAFIRRLFSIIIACIIISGTVLLIIWLILRPRVPEFRVDSLTVSNFNISTTSLVSGNWDVQFTVRNPNKKITVKYDRIDADVFYKSEGLASTTLPPFSQGKRNETQVKASFGAVGAYVNDELVRDIGGDRGRGNVKFSVRLLARARFKAGAWGTRKRYVRVLCRDVPVGLTLTSGRGSLVGDARECRVVT